MRSVFTRSLVLLSIAAPLLAQEGGEAAAKPGLLSLQSGLMFWTLVVFVILFVGLSKFAFGPITKAVADREQALLDAIEACESEIGSLAPMASASELDRLMAQLATIGGESSRANAEQQELTALVQRQLELVRQMRDRCEVLSQRRARLFNLMRGMWTQVSALRDTDAGSQRLRELLAEIAAELG